MPCDGPVEESFSTSCDHVPVNEEGSCLKFFALRGMARCRGIQVAFRNRRSWPMPFCPALSEAVLAGSCSGRYKAGSESM